MIHQNGRPALSRFFAVNVDKSGDPVDKFGINRLFLWIYDFLMLINESLRLITM